MNNDLEQFSEERLKELSNINGDINTRFCDADIEALARIALAARQELKVNATLRNINLNLSREAYSASLELNDLLKDNQHVYQVMNSLGDSQLWVDCSEDAYKCEIDEGGVGRILFTTPQPAHTEQGGWKLVPIEPTEKMKAAAEGEYSLKLAYKAMLRAAPKPESE